MCCRYLHVFQRPKLDYNKLHPYTSWIPILCWIVVRGCDVATVLPCRACNYHIRKLAVCTHIYLLMTRLFDRQQLFADTKSDARAAELQLVAVRLAGLHHAGDIHRPVPHLAAHRFVQRMITV